LQESHPVLCFFFWACFSKVPLATPENTDRFSVLPPSVGFSFSPVLTALSCPHQFPFFWWFTWPYEKIRVKILLDVRPHNPLSLAPPFTRSSFKNRLSWLGYRLRPSKRFPAGHRPCFLKIFNFAPSMAFLRVVVDLVPLMRIGYPF